VVVNRPQVPQTDPLVVVSCRQHVNVGQVNDTDDGLSGKPGSGVIDELLVLLVQIDSLVLLLLNDLLVEHSVQVPRVDGRIRACREQTFLPLHVAEAVLSAGKPELPRDHRLAVSLNRLLNDRILKEHNGLIRQRNSDHGSIRNVLKRQDVGCACDLIDELHMVALVDLKNAHVLFKHEHFVQFFDVVDLLDVVVVGIQVLDQRVFVGEIGGVFDGVALPDFVLDQVGGQILKFEELALFCSVKEVY